MSDQKPILSQGARPDTGRGRRALLRPEDRWLIVMSAGYVAINYVAVDKVFFSGYVPVLVVMTIVLLNQMRRPFS